MFDKLKKLEEKPIDTLILRALTSWCISALIMLLYVEKKFTVLEAYDAVGLTVFILVFCAVFAFFSAYFFLFKKKKIDVFALPIAFGIYSFITLLSSSKNYYFAFGLIILWAILIFYYQKQGFFRNIDFSSKTTKLIVFALGFVFVFFVGVASVLRYESNWAPNFDFGIFCNMYYNMKESFVPLTTCERDTLLSHFAVHMSPIYYLLLPFYFVVPSPATLQLMQVIVLASAVIPMYLLAKHFNLSNTRICALCAVLLLHPAVAAGTNYDLHENCFLLPLLMWSFLFFEKEKYIPMSVFLLLTLTVKEDAAVYVIFFALYVFLSRRKYLLGAIIAAVAGIYFLIVLSYLGTSGDGVMSWRYGNFIVGEGGLFDAVKNVLVNPAYVFTQIFIDSEGAYASKILFILQLFVPLAFLPVGTKKVSRLILILPFVLLNLMTLYSYQYNISFQYTFGPMAFLFYLSAMNVKDMKPVTSKTLLSIACVAACSLFVISAVQTFSYYTRITIGSSENIEITNEVLDSIPEEASVIASSYFVPRLSERKIIYSINYHEVKEGEKVDFVIIDTRENYEPFLEKYLNLGYSITDTVEGTKGEVLIYILEP